MLFVSSLSALYKFLERTLPLLMSHKKNASSDILCGGLKRFSILKQDGTSSNRTEIFCTRIYCEIKPHFSNAIAQLE